MVNNDLINILEGGIPFTCAKDNNISEHYYPREDDPASGSTSTYRFFVNFSLPIATTLILDDKNILSFDNGVYGLYIRCGSSDELDVIIG